jgi:hypothetical protein
MLNREEKMTDVQIRRKIYDQTTGTWRMTEWD